MYAEMYRKANVGISAKTCKNGNCARARASSGCEYLGIFGMYIHVQSTLVGYEMIARIFGRYHLYFCLRKVRKHYAGKLRSLLLGTCSQYFQKTTKKINKKEKTVAIRNSKAAVTLVGASHKRQCADPVWSAFLLEA